MKRIYSIFTAVLLSASLYGQSPQSFSYQAIVRGANNVLVSNKQVGLKISLLQGSENGNPAYVETHSPIANENGLVSIVIGSGTKVNGTFASIDWSKGPYFIKTETDPSGGTSYSLTTMSQLMSVPYALFAANSQPGLKGDTGAQGPAGKDGVDGKDGLPGTAGVDGAQGPAGKDGVDGKDGLPGTAGVDGAQGPAGKDGLPGTAGKDGKVEFQSLKVSTTGDTLYLQNGGFVIIPGISAANYQSQPVQGSIQSIDCDAATKNGTLTENSAASGVNSVIAYTGGNGGTYAGQTILSSGVSGLTATLASGSFAKGSGNLIYDISGTPIASGTASFVVNIGGKTCTFLMIIDPVFAPTSGYGPDIYDIDHHTIKTVYIGTQQWMAENLTVTRYNDGSTITNITDNAQWQSNISGAWAYYDNDVNNAKYGKLYNWYAVSPTTNGNKNVCPTGWHVPTDDEWTVLFDYLGGGASGGKMKEEGTTSWNSPNTGATNSSLFTGLPGGNRSSNGNYFYIGNYGGWWSSTKYDTDDAWARFLYYNNGGAVRGNNNKRYGLSVRCLRD